MPGSFSFVFPEILLQIEEDNPKTEVLDEAPSFSAFLYEVEDEIKIDSSTKYDHIFLRTFLREMNNPTNKIDPNELFKSCSDIFDDLDFLKTLLRVLIIARHRLIKSAQKSRLDATKEGQLLFLSQTQLRLQVMIKILLILGNRVNHKDLLKYNSIMLQGFLSDIDSSLDTISDGLYTQHFTKQKGLIDFFLSTLEINELLAKHLSKLNINQSCLERSAASDISHSYYQAKFCFSLGQYEVVFSCIAAIFVARKEMVLKKLDITESKSLYFCERFNSIQDRAQVLQVEFDTYIKQAAEKTLQEKQHMAQERDSLKQQLAKIKLHNTQALKKITTQITQKKAEKLNLQKKKEKLQAQLSQVSNKPAFGQLNEQIEVLKKHKQALINQKPLETDSVGIQTALETAQKQEAQALAKVTGLKAELEAMSKKAHDLKERVTKLTASNEESEKEIAAIKEAQAKEKASLQADNQALGAKKTQLEKDLQGLQQKDRELREEMQKIDRAHALQLKSFIQDSKQLILKQAASVKQLDTQLNRYPTVIKDRRIKQ